MEKSDPLIERAAELLHRGGLVAFPTETVYGLGADATNAAAVRRIFLAKGRPATNPLICHLADVAIARRYAAQWPEAAERLAREFWPGPLTLVLPKKSIIVDEATAGLQTVGLRAPNHPLTLELLRRFDGPLAGPSANRSTHVSPTTVEHVREDLSDAVDLVLDGGSCAVGIESTVLDLTARPTILRPGGVSREAIEAIIGPVGLFTGATPSAVPTSSPGQLARHYAPRTTAYRFDRAQAGRLTGARVGVIALPPAPRAWPEGWRSIEMPATPDAYASTLYRTLRELDAEALECIYIENPPDEPQWLAIRDRIRRATRPHSD